MEEGGGEGRGGRGRGRRERRKQEKSKKQFRVKRVGPHGKGCPTDPTPQDIWLAAELFFFEACCGGGGPAGQALLLERGRKETSYGIQTVPQ